MRKQEPPPSSAPGNVGRSAMKEDRYYIQRLTEQVFLIRERLFASEGPKPTDRHVRSFDNYHDASQYVSSANELQRELDAQHGHWTQHAIGER
ncbi:MAG: hypothetical protein J2P37_20430 [Ktedonobacteraceae bacterium]|nr:hypothetical protein [Ktedonobacteraceae bacterium]MBO0791723.1 hypothetical protein [Ktedonobacteraceae bacterium]